MDALVWVAVLLPLAGCALTYLPELPRRAAGVCITTTLLSLAIAVFLLGRRIAFRHSGPFESSITFLDFPGAGVAGSGTPTGFRMQVGVLLDNLSASVMCVVAAVSLLVQVHSLRYLRGDGGLRRYFAVLSLLTFALLGLVASRNLFTLLLMWVLVSACSALLVGHWWHRPAAVAAARRVLLINQVGDLSLLLAAVAVLARYAQDIATRAPGTDPLDLRVLFEETARVQAGQVAGAGTRTLTVIAVLLLVAAAVRAAQLPLGGWLGRAMEGPAPASALALSAGMAATGVYLVARTYPALLAAPHVLAVLAVVGAASAVYGAVVALAHTDVKRILAAATTSQLGLALVALGVGAIGAGTLQLITHAWTAALLGLCAANVILVYRTQDVRLMGGVRSRMPVTAATMLVGCASSAGVVLLAGFFADQSILAGVLRNQFPDGSGHLAPALRAILVPAVCAALVLGAAHPFRLLWLAAGGEPARRRGFAPERIREADGTMLLPVVVLAVLAAAGGLGGIEGVVPSLQNFVFVGDRAPRFGFSAGAGVLVAVLALAGAAGATAIWRRGPAAAPLRALRARVGGIAAAGLWLESAVDWLGTRAAGRPATLPARFDAEVIDPALDAVGEGVSGVAATSTRLQPGRWVLYGIGAVGGAVALLALLTLGATGHLPNPGPRP